MKQNKSERMETLKKLVNKYGLNAFQYNTDTETVLCKEGRFYMDTDQRGVFLRNWTTGNDTIAC